MKTRAWIAATGIAAAGASVFAIAGARAPDPGSACRAHTPASAPACGTEAKPACGTGGEAACATAKPACGTGRTCGAERTAEGAACASADSKPTEGAAAEPAAEVRTAHDGHGAWLNDYANARRLARETKRPILVNFSGSDWCGWCIRLDNEVLDQEAFLDYARDHLVLFNADFPRRSELPEATAQQNRRLTEQFGVEGFPTVLLIDPDETVLARTGYRPGGPEAYVEHLRNALANADHSTTQASTPRPWEYDAEHDRHWHPGHGHWHPGRPPADR